jgi:hypothetical protein
MRPDGSDLPRIRPPHHVLSGAPTRDRRETPVLASRLPFFEGALGARFLDGILATAAKGPVKAL